MTELGNSLLDAEFASDFLYIDAIVVTLMEKSKQSVLDALAFLIDNPNVMYADTDAYNYFAIEKQPSKVK